MDGTVIYMNQTYSLAKRDVEVEWIEKSFDVDIVKPFNYDVRRVEADINDNGLTAEFSFEIKIDYDMANDIINMMSPNVLVSRRPRTCKIAWFSPELMICIILYSYKNLHNTLFGAKSVEDIKKRMLDNEL